MSTTINYVMVIDDDDSSISRSKIIVEDHCNYVIVKRTAQKGLKYLCDSTDKKTGLPFPDLILVDINIPGTGSNFIEDYKEIKLNLPLKPKIVLLTSIVDLNDILKYSAVSEIADIYQKPFTSVSLKEIVREHFASMENNIE